MTTVKAGKTRTRILEAARELFNTQGERQVSTNHIAASLGMSPGNLYYHFRNKGEIVRALFSAYAADIEQSIAFSEDKPFTIDDKRQLLETGVQIIWHYRFAHRDIEYLLAEDELLRQSILELFQKTGYQMRQLFQLMIEGGMFKINERELEALIYNSWMVLVSWVGFLGSSMVARNPHDFSQETIRRGLYQLLILDKPYITAAYQQDYQALLDEYYVAV